MTSILLAGLVLCSSVGVSPITGQVVGPDQQPIAQAQVFLEPGLGGELRDTITSASGAFHFPDVAPGAAGIFAVAPGFGFEGQHITVAVADEVPPIKLTLHKVSEIRGTIVDPNGDPVEGARITRIGVKGAYKVGIPLAKLRDYGYAEPVSDEKGHFVLDNVPEGAMLDIKVGHPSFAQEGFLDAPAGSVDTRITLYPGVLVEGEVVSRANQGAVGQAAVLVKNAQPPHDTATTRANLSGKFSMRLKPGVYAYQAYGAGLRSAGWAQLTITGERPIERLRVAVAGTGTIRGNVRDAISGNPVRGVRVSLTTNGTTADIARTGPGGDFLFSAGEGENIVRIDATPGYFPPETQDVKLTILEGNNIELPGMWLKPLPKYAVHVIDGAGDAVPGALVSILRPRQFGWYVADENGTAQIHVQQFPAEGVLLGRAEHPSLPQAALFRLSENQGDVATVQLFDTGTVTGRVVNSRGRGIAGASVGAFFPGEAADDAIVLWQTFSDGDGQFRWDAVVPGVPQRCASRTKGGESGESMTFNLAPAEEKSLGDITVAGGESGESLVGANLQWYTWDLLCGTLPAKEICATSPALLVFTSTENTGVYLESLLHLRTVLGEGAPLIVLVVNGTPDCDTSTFPVVSGSAQNGASAILVDRAGKVVLESSIIPPVQLLRAL